MKATRRARRASYTVHGRGVRRLYKGKLVAFGARTWVDGYRQVAEEANGG